MFDGLTNTESPQTGNEDIPLKDTLPASLTAISHKSKLMAIFSEDGEFVTVTLKLMGIR